MGAAVVGVGRKLYANPMRDGRNKATSHESNRSIPSSGHKHNWGEDNLVRAKDSAVLTALPKQHLSVSSPS